MDANFSFHRLHFIVVQENSLLFPEYFQCVYRENMHGNCPIGALLNFKIVKSYSDLYIPYRILQCKDVLLADFSKF